MLTLAEIKLLIEAVATLMAEYGETPERVALEEKLREHRKVLLAEIERYR